MDILKTCIPLKERKTNMKRCGPQEWEIRGRMGESSVFGQVYLSCCKQKCDSVMKIQPIKSQKGEDETTRESEIQYLMAEKGIGPKIFYSNICNGNSVIIMEALEKTAWEYMKETQDPIENEKVIVQILEILTKMHLLGYVHGDPHLDNFMITFDQKEYKKILGQKIPNFHDLKFQTFAIDFGMSEEISETSLTVREDYEKLVTDLVKRYEDSEWTVGKEGEFSKVIRHVLEKLQN